ncbi:hypothetical protein JYT74_02485 [Crocinitomix catalasitica]|nr:hypothetical protein [Crocinitomix catalasitica]
MKGATIFLVTTALFFAFFYFYPAEIFECTVDEGYITYTKDLSLKAVLFGQAYPDVINVQDLVNISLSWKGMVIMFVCILGLPAMMAWRSTVKRTSRPTNSDVADE